MSVKNEGPLKLGISLAIYATVAACLLAFTSELTKAPIIKNKGAKVAGALRQLLPQFDNDPVAGQVVKTHDGTAVTFYPATLAGKLVGFAVISSSQQGYGGVVKVMVSLDPEGRIRTVIVTEHQETPGLGTAVTDRKRQKTLAGVASGAKPAAGLPPNPVLDQFTGRDCAAAPWKVRKDGGDVDEITGATVSSRAVTDAVNRLAQAFTENRAELLTPFAAAKKGNAP